MELESIIIKPNVWSIKLGGRAVGRIERKPQGYRYVPRSGHGFTGNWFPTFRECIDSLATDK